MGKRNNPEANTDVTVYRTDGTTQHYEHLTDETARELENTAFTDKTVARVDAHKH